MTVMNTQPGQITEKLKKLEMFLHHPEFGTSKEALENMMEENFWEVGASGNIYDRNILLNVLAERASNPNREEWELKDFKCSELSEVLYLVTYTLTQDDGRITRRSSIWKRYDLNWKIVYHQGTIV